MDICPLSSGAVALWGDSSSTENSRYGGAIKRTARADKKTFLLLSHLTAFLLVS